MIEFMRATGLALFTLLGAQTLPMAAALAAEEAGSAVTDRQVFADRAMAANRFETESSKLALVRSKAPEVRDFAERMIADHDVAAQTLATALRDETIAAEGTLSKGQQEALDALKAAPDDQFDLAYLSAQMAAHEEAIGLFDGYLKHAAAGPLRDFAETTLPALVLHRKQVLQLAGQ